MKAQVLSFILFLFLSVNISPQIFATEASPEVHRQSVQKKKKNFKERLISNWIQKKVEEVKRKQTKKAKRKRVPTDVYIAFGLTMLAYLYLALILIVAVFTLIPAPAITLMFLEYFFLSLIPAFVGGIMGIFADIRLTKKENSSRHGKVLAKLAWALGFGFITGFLVILIAS